MVKTIIYIDGMMCGMCESHINDVIRKKFQVHKVSSSHRKGESTVISDNVLEESLLKKAIEETGYQYLRMETEEYRRKGILGFIKGEF